MSYHQGFMYFSNAYGNAVEVVNEARTIDNMRIAINSGVKRYGDLLAYAGCPVLAKNPCTMASNGVVTTWQALSTGLSNAPWANPASPAALEAYGFLIEEWTGLDGAHHGRETTPFGSGRGGSVLAPFTSSGRTMAINMVLVGSSERGLNYLFRWLESTLIGCCDPNDNPTLWIREYCTGSVDPTDGLAHTDGVALIAGPTWEAPPVEDAGCFLRRVSFTLATSSPSFFREPVDIITATQLKSAITGATAIEQPAPLGRWISTSVRTTATMPTPEYGLVSPIVTFSSANVTTTAGVRMQLPRMRIVGFLNPSNAAATDLSRMYPIGALVLDNIPSGATVVVDIGAGKIWYTDNYTSLETVSGMNLIQPVGPTFASGSAAVPDMVGARLKRWFGFNNCQIGVVAVEPDTVPTTTQLLSSGTITTDWSVKIQSAMRFGSC